MMGMVNYKHNNNKFDERRSSKFYSKSLTLLVSILEMIKEGLRASEIARSLNRSKSLVSQYVTKAKEEGLVIEIKRDVFAELQLTQSGKKFLDQYQNMSDCSYLLCRAENIRFTALVRKLPRIPVDWRRIQMHNWTSYVSEIDSIRVKLNLGEIPTLEFLPSPVDGEGALELVVKLYKSVRRRRHA